MLEDLKEIESKLEQLSKELDTQLSATSLESDKFHENLINLLSKFPDDKELIQFIVFINDRLVTNHEISRDILYETVKGLITQKQYLIKRLIKEQEASIKKQHDDLLIIKMIDFLKNNKTTLIVMAVSISTTLLLVSLFVIPDTTMETLKLIKGFTK